MRHQFITAQLLGQARAALDAEASQLRPRASITDHLLRHGLVWGALTLLALVASATVVSGLN
jgi:hypothetical protein